MLSRRSGLAALGVAVLVLSSCTPTSNAPDEYGDQTRTNFVASCSGDILPTAKDEAERTSEVDLPSEASCVCLYDYFVAEVPFDRFDEIDGEVEDDPGVVPAELQAAMDSCAAGPTAPASGGDATTTTEG